MRKRQYLFFAISLLLSTHSVSQSVKDTIKLETIPIQPKKGVVDLEKIPLKDITTSTDRNIGEVLSRKTHLFVKSYGIGSISTISMRGTGSSHTNLYWNNLNLNSTTNGIADVSLYPGFFLDALSLNQGVTSNQLGSGGLGGSIHFQTDNKVEHTAPQLSQTFGSFGLSTTAAQIGFQKKRLSGQSKFYYSVAENDFKYQDLTIEGFPTRKVDNARYEQKGFMQNLTYQAKSGTITARFWAFDSDRNLPPFITIRENLENQKDRYQIGQLVYQKRIKGGHLKVQSSIKHTDLEYNNLQASIYSKSSTLNSSSIFILKKNLKGPFQLNSRLSYDYNTVQDESFTGKIDRQIISWYKNLKFYGSASNKKFKRWNALLSLRQEYLIDEDYFFIPTLEFDFQLLSNRTLHLFSKVGRNIKYPSLNDLYREPFANPNLKTEKSTATEVGLKLEEDILKQQYRSLTKVTLFYNNIEDYIQWQPTIFGFWQPINLKAVETYGVEVNQEINSTGKILQKQLQILYAYTESINQNKLSRFDESQGKQLIYIPRNKVNINASLTYKNYQLAYSYQYVSERFTSSDNFDQVDGFQLSDITLGKEFLYKEHQIDLHFSVLNIFNTSYQAIQWRPMPGRNYQVKINYQLKK